MIVGKEIGYRVKLLLLTRELVHLKSLHNEYDFN